MSTSAGGGDIFVTDTGNGRIVVYGPDGTYRRDRDPKSYAHDSTTGRIKFGTESNGGFKNITWIRVPSKYLQSPIRV